MTSENEIASEVKVIPRKPFDLVESVLRHWLKIAVFGFVLFMLCLPVCLVKRQPFYKTEGRLLVSPVTTTYMQETDEDPVTSDYYRYVQTQVQRIADQENLEKAIQSMDESLKEEFQPGGMSVSVAARILGSRITVTNTASTHFIVVGIKGMKTKGLAEAVNSVMAAYLDRLQDETENLESRRLKYLEDEEEQLSRQIDEYTKKYNKMAEETGTIYFREATNVFNTSLESIEREYINAYSHRVEKQNLLLAARKDAERLKTLPLDAAVEELIQQSGTTEQMDLYTFKQVDALKNSMEGLSDGNPDKELIEEKIKILSLSNEQTKAELKETARKVLEGSRDIELAEAIIRAESEYEAAKVAEKNVEEKKQEILAEKAEMSQKLLEGQFVEEKLTKFHTQLNKIEERINLLKLESRAPGNISLSSLARTPIVPTGSNMKKLLALSFIFSFGGIGGLIIFFDIRDDRVRSKKHVRQALGTTTTWPISDYLLTREKEIPFARVTLDDSSNVVSKAIHSLAIRLNQERLNRGARLVVFNGVDAKSGVTEILVNVAHAMTLNCKKVAVVDANLANPGIARNFNIDEDKPGLTDVIKGHASLKDCVTICKEHGVHVLPAGTALSLDEINRLDRSRINRLLDKIKNEYEYVLVDSCPVLVSDFSEFLVINADVVSLVVQGDRSRYKPLYMIGTILSRLQVPAVAVVLNWGAPRYPTELQKIVSRIFRPIYQRMVISPKWSVRHGENSEIDKVPNAKGRWIARVKKVKLAKFINRNLIIGFCLIVIVVFSGVAVFDNLRAASTIIPNAQQQVRAADAEKFFQVMREKSGPQTFVSFQKSGEADVEEQEMFPVVQQPAEMETVVAKEAEKPSLANSSWIMNSPKDYYSIQLMGSFQKEDLIRFSGSVTPIEKMAIFQKRHNNRDWYVLIYGMYSDKQQAVCALEDIPTELKTASPWIRRVENIQAEIIQPLL